MRRRFVVELHSEAGQQVHPLKRWLRHNPGFIPEGMDATRSTSHELRNGLRKLGWSVKETDTEVCLTMPADLHSETPTALREQKKRKRSWGRLGKQIVGNVGLYYVCYQLSRLGWNVMVTARNARGLDIIAYGADCSRFVGVQVKALSKRDPVPLGASLDSVIGDFWIIVDNLASTPRAFVMLPGEVKNLAHRGEKDGRVSYWLQPSSYDAKGFAEAWERIGCGGSPFQGRP